MLKKGWIVLLILLILVVPSKAFGDVTVSEDGFLVDEGYVLECEENVLRLEECNKLRDICAQKAKKVEVVCNNAVTDCRRTWWEDNSFFVGLSLGAILSSSIAIGITGLTR